MRDNTERRKRRQEKHLRKFDRQLARVCLSNAKEINSLYLFALWYIVLPFEDDILGGSGVDYKRIIDEYESKQEYKNDSVSISTTNRFKGMTQEKAKAEYRKLMKMYHPDNAATGDEAEATKIQAEYDEYLTYMG